MSYLASFSRNCKFSNAYKIWSKHHFFLRIWVFKLLFLENSVMFLECLKNNSKMLSDVIIMQLGIGVFRLVAKADRVYVMPSLYFVRKFYNLRTYAARPCRVFTAFFKFKVPFLLKVVIYLNLAKFMPPPPPPPPVFKIPDFNDMYLCQ